MRALVIGGGIAGPATGLALRKAGIDAVVLEARSRAMATAGSYLTVAPNGLHALDVIGALDLARACGFPTATNVMYSATGARLGRVSLGVPLPDGTRALTMKRARLARVLADEAERRGVDVRWSSRVDAVEENPHGVSVRLTDGSRLNGDLLVGADGVHSLVRRTIDPTASAARYVGLTNFGGVTRGAAAAAGYEAEAWHFVFGSGAFFGAHPTPEGDVVWFLNVPRAPIGAAERAATSHETWREWLASLVQADAGPAADLIRGGELELTADNTHDLPHVPVWRRGRLVVLGDAAHAPSPSSGQGASMALEDAVVLATSLRDSAFIEDGFAAYESARRERVERIVAAGARSSSAKIPGPMGRVFRDAALRLVFRLAVTDRSTAWMTGHRVAWPATGGVALRTR